MADSQVTIEYRDVPGFPGYRVGSDGSVWSQWATCIHGRIQKERWKRLKESKASRGYVRVNLTDPFGVVSQFRIHRLVLEVFVGKCPEGMECRHLNGIKTDNRAVNLAWGTPLENASDRKRHGNPNHRLKLFTHDGRTMPLKDWAREFGIEYTCLWQRIYSLGMSFAEAVLRPYLGTKSNGGHWTKAKRGSKPA